MPITSKLSADQKGMTITVEGTFDFRSHSDFKKCYIDKEPLNWYVIDLANSSPMDSSALGMVLLLRDFAGGEKSNIKIVNADASAKKIFNAMYFDKLFDIS